MPGRLPVNDEVLTGSGRAAATAFRAGITPIILSGEQNFSNLLELLIRGVDSSRWKRSPAV